MTIKRKTGEPYKLRGPNKLLVSQNFWDLETTYLKNFEHLVGEPIEIDSAPPKKPVRFVEPAPNDRIISHEETLSIINSVNDTVAESEPPIDLVPEPKPVLPPTDKPKSQFRARERFVLYCLPAERVEQRLRFKDPFQFQASLAEIGDIRIAYWTTVSQVTEGSVIFDPSRRRWWRATRIVSDQQGDGVMVHCLPSDIKPDFTEQMTSAESIST